VRLEQESGKFNFSLGTEGEPISSFYRRKERFKRENGRREEKGELEVEFGKTAAGLRRTADLGIKCINLQKGVRRFKKKQ